MGFPGTWYTYRGVAISSSGVGADGGITYFCVKEIGGIGLSIAVAVVMTGCCLGLIVARLLECMM